MKLDIITPGKQIFSGEAEMVVLPGEAGEMGVLSGHAPVITTLQAGSLLSVYEGSNVTNRFFIYGGFAEVNQTNCSVLATEVDDLSKVTKTEIEERISKAEVKAKLADNEFDRKRAEETIELNKNLLEKLAA
ncbi:MAG TPA: ATP synthase F1 subunit epsilon [Alphaproteobacteria bacterium]|nr:ATP synthase F1 subunit epsilon [Alphaproteobacteria bacterium]